MELKLNSRVGNWKIISEIFKKDKCYQYKCECICGKIKDIRAWHLKQGKTKGCGCTNTIGRFKYKGCNDLSLSYFNSIKKRAITKDIPFEEELTIDFLWHLFLRQNKKCALSNLDIELDQKWSNKVKGSLRQSASLDRIDSSKGYTKDNVQWVHKKINLMKNTLNQNEFIAYCKQVAFKKEDICQTIFTAIFSKETKI
jgi:hypothetical protein